MDDFKAGAHLCVLGAGSWGATLASHLHHAGSNVRLWCHDQGELESLLKSGHPPGVPELKLPAMERATSNLAEALEGVEAAVLVVPSQVIKALCDRMRNEGIAPPTIIIASKGIDLATLRPLSDVVTESLPGTTVAVVSGPCIAREVARGIPTSVVAACSDEELGARIQRWFASPTFRVYRQDDVLGVEYGGALKNVIAIAAGVGDGLGFGANSKSALLTRGLAEMQRFAVAMGANERTIAGLAGLGDLCVTCFSDHSRNRRFGEALGRGGTASDALKAIGETVEGVETSKAVVSLAEKHGLEVPVAEAVCNIISGVWSPTEAVGRLMGRSLKDEFWSG
ncbi:MAG: NAD(P)-dependent glycerol-3-phosphate dehydrogenase [Candidatus Sumerlaeia bacterium]|nr:NAD(P)-dependent glycerol-3-phosphate dehydrogenase [Candidatus Sumerlaeia bacterium]